METYDCHVHTKYSPDGKSTMDEMCKTAVERGVSLVTFTDHNFPVPDGFDCYENIKASVLEAKKKNIEYGDKLTVLSGLELADQFIDDLDCTPFYDIEGIDCILGSIHSTPIMEKYFPSNIYGRNLNTAVYKADEEFLKKFVVIYYEELLKTVEYADIDVVAHLTFPFRYINGMAKRDFDICDYYPYIDEVLKAVIRKGLALEINTSGKSWEWNEFMPDEDILKRYFDFGGRILSVGSDAHSSKNLGVGIADAYMMLKDLGFTHGSYYKNRKRYEYKF